VLGIIRPTVEAIGEVTRSRHVGVLATEGTIRSHSYPLEIRKLFPEIEVVGEACPMWVPLVETNEYASDGADYFVKRHIDNLLSRDPEIDTIILGCTHYPLLMDAISSLVPDLNIISSSEAAAETLRRSLIEQDLLKETLGSTRRYYVSDDPDHFHENAVLFLGDEIQAEAELVRV
jgi:glutamate racemase